MKYCLSWMTGHCASADTRPEVFFEAVVPGAVQLDYARAHGLPDYRRGMNFEERLLH